MDIKSMNEALMRHNSQVDQQPQNPDHKAKKAKSTIKLSKTQQKVVNLIAEAQATHHSFRGTNKDIHNKIGVASGYASQTINKLFKHGLINVKGKTSNRAITLTDKAKPLVTKSKPTLVKKPKAPKIVKPVQPKHKAPDIMKIWNQMPKAQQKIFSNIASDTSSNDDDDRHVTRLSNGDLARQSKVSHTYASAAVGRLKKAGFIKTAGFTENRIIFLAPMGYKMLQILKDNGHKLQQMANKLPKLQSKVFSLIFHNMKKPDQGKDLICHLTNKQISQKLHVKYSSTTATLAVLRKKHLIRNSGTGSKRIMILTPKGRHLAKHVDPNYNHARSQKSSIMIGTNRINLNDLVPLNVHSPIYPYELIFKRGDKDSEANPFVNGNDEITLKGSKFFELLKKYDAVRFYQDQAHPDIIGLKPCRPNRSDPAVVKLIKHNHRIVIWSYMLVQAFNRNAKPGTSQHLYIPGKKLNNIILFNSAKVQEYFK
ncbi:hypothetical protein [Acetilactobacillus jinshanensis]|uniref:Uncharacterized protein n=1 Tax=Acetilactobacillus jinshanensis TaxID=1720083 RepID=A0A4P6ZKQ8_9LACO|nr:hypothetical protein [Acetilactobacillus jinshanensis]QBP18238.1 hypothetical protein ELX58_03610 [Acetilactobacillus jinshanensis]URL61108.1 hypothetical protein HGK75_03685 [uncultured bacterium]